MRGRLKLKRGREKKSIIGNLLLVGARNSEQLNQRAEVLVIMRRTTE